MPPCPDMFVFFKLGQFNDAIVLELCSNNWGNCNLYSNQCQHPRVARNCQKMCGCLEPTTVPPPGTSSSPTGNITHVKFI